VGSTNTRTVVLDGSVRDGEFGKVVTNHFRLDFNIVEGLTVVNTNNRTNHFRNDEQVTEVSLDSFRTFVFGTFSLLQITISKTKNIQPCGVSSRGPWAFSSNHGGIYDEHEPTTTLDQLNNNTTNNTYINKFHQFLRRHIQQLI